VIASITISSKGLCDSFCTNSLYAKVGGISLSELNLLEREFLALIDWRLTVSLDMVMEKNESYLVYMNPSIHCQCTREILQEYYVNLIRTNSTGMFVIESHTFAVSDGEFESDASVTSVTSSHPSSPILQPHSPAQRRGSTVLIGTATLTPDVRRGPTVEQNMVFAALQRQQNQSSST
jgi:hypothetical protein